MTEQILSPSTPLIEPASPRPCPVCGDFTDAPICARCLALAGPQSIMHQHDWESWEPPEETLTRRPKLVEVESQFQPALASSDKKSTSNALKRRLKSLRSSKSEDDPEGKSLILSGFTIFFILLIIFYVGSMILGIDPLYLVMRFFPS